MISAIVPIYFAIVPEKQALPYKMRRLKVRNPNQMPISKNKTPVICNKLQIIAFNIAVF